jgi:methylated-DNA-[protein]-cysteine S-methyltransferase
MPSFLALDSPVGTITIVGDDGQVTAVHLDDLTPDDTWRADRTALGAAAAQLEAYFDGTLENFDLPLNAAGTAFQRAVWHELSLIPFGEVTTYGEIARRVGKPTGSRAVGAANGRNPIAIVVPCHRVIGADGTLTGYAGGMWRKQWLLKHEGYTLA